MGDMMFLGVPALGAVVLLFGSILLGVKLRYGWYAVPAIFGLLSLLSIISVIAAEPGSASTFGWLGTIVWFVIGWIALSIVRKRDASRS